VRASQPFDSGAIDPLGLARSVECAVHTVAEQRQPLEGFVAEHEADVALGDLTAPAAHRRRRDLLLEQTVRDLLAIEPEHGDVEQERPRSSRSDGGEAVELAQSLVAPPLALRVRFVQVIVGQAERNPGPDLGEPARHEAVVDLDA
jgi:hypothetical protein